MAEHSPIPWKLDGRTIRDAEGDVVVSTFSPANMETRRLIVASVNERDSLREELDSVNAQLNWHKRQLKAVKADAESEERWANQYFEQAQAAEAENARLRDLVRRLIPAVKTAYIYEKKIGAEAIAACLEQGVPAGGIVEVVDEWRDLLREAQEAAAKEDDKE